MSLTEVVFTKREDQLPVCPHCQADLNQINFRTKGLGWIEGKNVVYFCPHCRKVLGLSHRKGFWMG